MSGSDKMSSDFDINSKYRHKKFEKRRASAAVQPNTTIDEIEKSVSSANYYQNQNVKFESTITNSNTNIQISNDGLVSLSNNSTRLFEDDSLKTNNHTHFETLELQLHEGRLCSKHDLHGKEFGSNSTSMVPSSLTACSDSKEILMISPSMSYDYNRIHKKDISPSAMCTSTCSLSSNADQQSITGRNICHYCQLVCTKPSVLEKHIRAHTNERPYPCKLCGFAFKTKSNLHKHYK